VFNAAAAGGNGLRCISVRIIVEIGSFVVSILFILNALIRFVLRATGALWRSTCSEPSRWAACSMLLLLLLLL
jgi:hypothetical protein